MSKKGVVALIGSPNVGKSTIFNRIVGKRTSIVDDLPGVTRDRIYANSEWLGVNFSIIDTGGIELEKKTFQQEIRMQAEIAINEADVIIFIVDGKSGLNTDDKYVTKLLYKSKKPVVLAVNKIDNSDKLYDINEFYSLGFDKIIPVSGVHGIGIGDLLDEVIKLLPKKEEVDDEDVLKYSIIGRPNVGKSSLVNAILNDNRVIVSDIEGTTRDSINSKYVRNGKTYEVIDTAGIKKRGQIYESIDRYALLRAMSSIDESDVILFVIDANRGLAEQDKHVVSYAIEQKKAIIIVANKWDLINKDQHTMDEFKAKLRKELKFLDYAPIVFVSALTKSRIGTLYNEIDSTFDAYNKRISTSLLNDLLQEAQMMNEAPDFNGGRVRIYFAEQVSIKPPSIVLFVNNPNYMHFSYLRYIENRIRESFDFDGTPINFILRKRV